MTPAPATHSGTTFNTRKIASQKKSIRTRHRLTKADSPPIGRSPPTVRALLRVLPELRTTRTSLAPSAHEPTAAEMPSTIRATASHQSDSPSSGPDSGPSATTGVNERTRARPPMTMGRTARTSPVRVKTGMSDGSNGGRAGRGPAQRRRRKTQLSTPTETGTATNAMSHSQLTPWKRFSAAPSSTRAGPSQ